MLQDLLNAMPVAPIDTTGLPVAQQTVLANATKTAQDAVDEGIDPVVVVRLAAFLCLVVEKSGLSDDQRESQGVKALLVRKAFLTNCSVSDGTIKEAVDEIRAHCGLPVLRI